MKKTIVALVIAFCFLLGSCRKDNDIKVNELSLNHDLIKQTAWKGTLTMPSGAIYNLGILFINNDKGECEIVIEGGSNVATLDFEYTVEGKCLSLIPLQGIFGGNWFLTEQSEDKSGMILKCNLHSKNNVKILELTKSY